MMKWKSLFTFIAVASVSFAALAQQQPATNPTPAGPQFKSLDRNGDGKIEYSEAMADERWQTMFDQFDLNHDGFVTAEEVQKFDERAKAGRSGKGE